MQKVQPKKSFTLVELMIVIAILAILSAIVIFALNPAKLFDNFRDSKRVTDITSINKAIVFMESWNQSGITYGTTTNVYISLPDANPSCSSYSLPTLPTGFVYYCSSPTSYKNTDGTGWIPINFTVEGANRYLSSLPVDPVNNNSFFYTYYTGGSYELTAILANPNKNSINDEGSLTSTYEIGSPNRTFNTPLQRDKNLIGYWDFNETSGTIAYDKSGNGNNGTLTNSPTRTATIQGEKVLSFDGVDDSVNISGNGPQIERSKLSIIGWASDTGIPGNSAVIGLWGGSTSTGSYFSLCYIKAFPKLYFRLRDHANNSETGTEGINTVSGVWYMVVGVFDKPTIKFYLNGASIYSSSWDYFPTINAVSGYSIGNGGFGAWKGQIDGVRMYNRALSAEEISKIYNTEKGKYQ